VTLIAQASVACPVGARLGEGPVWLENQRTLWFVDIAGNALHSFEPATGIHASWSSPERPSFVLPASSGTLLIGTRAGLQAFDPRAGSFTYRRNVEPHLSGNRLNDACIGPDGALWFGSMHETETEAQGALYRLHEGKLTEMDRGYIVSNGPAFSPDGRRFYHTDSVNRLIYEFDVDGGLLSNKRRLIQIETKAGFPDGTTVDAEGCLWVALWGGSALRRYSPRGELLGRVHIPTPYVTKVAFGGEDLQTAYVTTACQPLSAGQAAQPDAGHLFAFRSPVPGMPLPSLELEQGAH